MSAAPTLTPDRGDPILLRGEIPSPLDPPSGCRFRTRCWKATDECATPPPVVARDSRHTGLCHHPL
jgi:oligopeptide transport system ATP-binding protein